MLFSSKAVQKPLLLKNNLVENFEDTQIHVETANQNLKLAVTIMMADYPIGEEPIKVPRFEANAGFYTTKQRSYNMSQIKGKNSKPELMLRRALWAKNLRFRLHDKRLPGRPDIVIRKYKLVIFIDGEFWHGYQWEMNKHQIKSNRAFWIPKIERNMQKDRIDHQRLRDIGYTVFRFWSEEVKKNLPRVVNQVMLYVETAREIKIPTLN